MMDGLSPIDPQTADLDVGLAGAFERLDDRIDHCRIQSALVASPGLAV